MVSIAAMGQEVAAYWQVSDQTNNSMGGVIHTPHSFTTPTHTHPRTHERTLSLSSNYLPLHSCDFTFNLLALTAPGPLCPPSHPPTPPSPPTTHTAHNYIYILLWRYFNIYIYIHYIFLLEPSPKTAMERCRRRASRRTRRDDPSGGSIAWASVRL